MPSAGKLARVPIHIGLFEAETAENGFDARLHPADIVVLEPQLQVAEYFKEIAVFLGLWFARFHFFFDFGKLFLELLHVVKCLRGFFKDGCPFVLDSFLRQVADSCLFRLDDAPGIGIFDLGDDLHQGRLACSVGTGKRPALFRANGEGEILKKGSGAVFDGDFVYGEHGKGRAEIRQSIRQGSCLTLLRTSNLFPTAESPWQNCRPHNVQRDQRRNSIPMLGVSKAGFRFSTY